MVRILLAVVLALVSFAARAETVSEADARLVVEIAPLKETPFEQELVIITVRGHYAVPITLEKLHVPALDDFGWLQLGRDQWREEVVGGRKFRVFERRIALFPRRAGTLEIGPFEHRLTLLGSDGKRFMQPVWSEAVTLAAAAKPASSWWLPASALEMTDEWDRPPSSLEYGGALKRTITITAKGVSPDMLPPQPEMRGQGLIAFPDPEERGMETQHDGPVSRVVWRWTVRMLLPDTGPLEAKPLEWFDTVDRALKPLPIASVTVAIKGADTATPASSAGEGLGLPGLAGALCGGVLAGLALVLPGWRLKPWADIRHGLTPAFLTPEAQALRRAARSGDAKALWRAARHRPGKEELERHLFGPPAGPADVAALARRLSSAP